MLTLIPRFSLLFTLVVTLAWISPIQAHDYWMKADVGAAVQQVWVKRVGKG